MNSLLLSLVINLVSEIILFELFLFNLDQKFPHLFAKTEILGFQLVNLIPGLLLLRMHVLSHLDHVSTRHRLTSKFAKSPRMDPYYFDFN